MSTDKDFQKYLDSYDLKARGAGSDRGRSRFSALDVREVFGKGTDRFGLSKAEAARQVLDYADDMKGKTRMGGGTRKALDKIRGYLNQKEEKPKEVEYKPVEEQEKVPQSLQDSYDHYRSTDLTREENKPPRVDERITRDPSKDAISGGDDLVEWTNDKFIPHLEAEANYGSDQIGNDMNYFLEKFVYGPAKLGDASSLYEKYKGDIEDAADDD